MFQVSSTNTFRGIFILIFLIHHFNKCRAVWLKPPTVNATFRRLDPGTAKVWGAEFCPAKDYPFMVGIIKNPNSRGLDITCGGTLVHPRIVLTAASCIEDKVGLRVVLGLWLGQPAIVDVQSTVLHPGWTVQKRKIHHNIGLIFLEDEVHGVKLIRLPRRKYHGEMRASCPDTFLIGMGEIEPHKKINILRDGFSCGKLRTLDESDCFQAFPTLGQNYFKSAVCTYNSNNTMGVFRSDAGSPLICGDYQIGIVSFAIRYKTALPSVFTRVDFYTKWLRSKLPDMPDVKSTRSQPDGDYDYVQDKSARSDDRYSVSQNDAPSDENEDKSDEYEGEQYPDEPVPPSDKPLEKDSEYYDDIKKTELGA